MTLAIATLTSSGIVLCADSRQTYRNNVGATRIGSDTASKLFKLTDRCGVAISGKAFLLEETKTSALIKDTGYFINKFKKSINIKNLEVKQIAEKLNKYLSDLFMVRDTNEIKKQISDDIKSQGGKNLNFSTTGDNSIPYSYTDREGKPVSNIFWLETIHMIVAGTDKDKISRAYSVYIPQGVIAEKDTQQCGALWVGQVDVLMRIIRGYGPEIEALDFVKDARTQDTDSITAQLNKMEYIINWGTITLQDAVDFCVLMTRTTESIQRFSDGTLLSPGGIPGVGGEIDIVVITPESGFSWLKKKRLKTEGAELSLEQE